jgi:hypothetical protein
VPPVHHAPRYVPTGFALFFRADGPLVRGFGRDVDVAALLYTIGGADLRRRPGLTVHIATACDCPLVCTESHDSARVDLGISDVRAAAYHDGLWDIGPGIDQRGSAMVIHWNNTDFHSLTGTGSADLSPRVP